MQELGRLDAPGRPIVFGTTEEFLRNFGVDSTDNLPEISPVKMEDFRAEVEEEMQIKLDVCPGRRKRREIPICLLRTHTTGSEEKSMNSFR